MTRRRPDIILFNPDQWRSDVLGHLGNVWWGGKNDLVPGQESFDPYCHIRYASHYSRIYADVPPPLPPPQPLYRSDRQQEWRGDPTGDNYYSFYVLYDLGRDPQECRNVIAEPESGEAVRKLESLLLRRLLETSDVVPCNLDHRE